MKATQLIAMGMTEREVRTFIVYELLEVVFTPYISSLSTFDHAGYQRLAEDLAARNVSRWKPWRWPLFYGSWKGRKNPLLTKTGRRFLWWWLLGRITQEDLSRFIKVFDYRTQQNSIGLVNLIRHGPPEGFGV